MSMIIEEIKKEKHRSRFRKISRPIINSFHGFYHHVFLRHTSRILCNSMMKSGTHLLLGIVSNLPPYKYYGKKAFWHFLARARVNPQKNATIQKVILDLSSCLSGEISQGHIEANQEILQFLIDYQFKHVFIYRDLRDVVVSHFYGTKTRGIDTWIRRYFLSLDSDEERLAFLINGWPKDASQKGFPDWVDFPNIGERFMAFHPWLNNENCFTIRFEDLIEKKTKEETLSRLAKFLLSSPDEEKIRASINSMNSGFAPSKSKTFRKGISGEWENYFSKNHISMFKECAGKLLIDLGYEKDMNW
jgi:hypothetical protein